MQTYLLMMNFCRTNLPTCLMEFRGYKFQPESGRCYPGRAEVLKYIEDFARDFKLLPYIKVNFTFS